MNDIKKNKEIISLLFFFPPSDCQAVIKEMSCRADVYHYCVIKIIASDTAPAAGR